MKDVFERYAVFWVPTRTDALARFGSSWMGWCAENGEPRPRDAAAGLTDDIAAATRQVALCGFHGLIGAPFRLRDGRSRWSVEQALRLAADDLAAVVLPPLTLAVVGGQVALVPESPCRGLAELLDRVGQALAPLATDAATAQPAIEPAMTPDGKQLRQLPAGAAHRFRLPLTDRMDLGAAFRVRDELGPRLAPLLAQPRLLADLALMGDPGGGRTFRVVQRFELRETARRGAASALPVSGPQTLVDGPGAETLMADIAV